MFDKWQRSVITVLSVVILATLVDNRSYNNGLIFYDPQENNLFLPPTVSVSRGRALASVKYSSNGSIWSTFGKPCFCNGAFCVCCAGIRVRQYDFDQKLCANVTFLSKVHQALLDVYINNAPSARYGISARNPSPLCIPVMLPIPMAMCVQMSDIAIKGNNLHMCMDFVVRLATTDLFEMHFQCMKMGLDGVKYLDKDGKPVLPMSTNSQVMNNKTQTKEGNLSEDDYSLNENEIDSNENKVEQTDYEEEEKENEETDKVLDTVDAEAIDNEEEENAAEETDDKEDEVKDAENVDIDQNDAIVESVSNVQNLTINETADEKLDGNATLAAMQEHDMHKLENLVNVATMLPMATTTAASTTISTTTYNVGNNVKDVDAADKISAAVTEKANEADAHKDKDNDENEDEEQSAVENDEDNDHDDDDDDDESDDEDSDEDDEDDDEDESEDDDEQNATDVANNNNHDKNETVTKLISEISNSNIQLQPGAERISVAAASSLLPLFAISKTSPGTEETSSKRHLKLLNYRRARG